MKETKVVHCKKESYDVYIGRGSKWGNPYTHKEGTTATYKVASRDQAVDAYRHYILYGDGQHLLKDLHELEGKVLGCWCSPKRCHGDVLAQLIKDRQEEKEYRKLKNRIKRLF